MTASSPSSSSAADQPLLAVACPTCFGMIAVGEELFGEPADCPVCGSGFRVPRQTVSAHPKRPSDPRPADSQPRGSADGAANRRSRRESPRRESTPAAPSSQTGSTPLAGSPAAPEAVADSAPGGDYQFREPVRTVGVGDEAVELRRLSPEEKARRRSRRTFIIMLAGVSILLSIVLTLGRKRPKRRQP
ncbi:MAG: hypothetical protein ACKOTB_02015 [Planctomycetia bacterium]